MKLNLSRLVDLTTATGFFAFLTRKKRILDALNLLNELITGIEPLAQLSDKVMNADDRRQPLELTVYEVEILANAMRTLKHAAKRLAQDL